MNRALKSFKLICLSLFLSVPLNNIYPQGELNIPPRPAGAMEGSEFMESVTNLGFDDREDAILEQLLAGNIPDFTRNLIELEADFTDANGISHHVKYWIMPDYLTIGSDSDYCRIPMGPIIAQQAADAFGACMPTRKLVDNIYSNAEIKLAPVTYVPVGNQNTLVPKFIEHNTAIQQQFINAGGVEGQLIGGTKKDVVLSNKIIDPSRPGHVVIYGWHQLNGNPIQPLTNIHVNYYVDYSHGIRLLDRDIEIDGEMTYIDSVLKDANLYKILSDETGPMYYPTYLYELTMPPKPKAFAVISENPGEVKVILIPDFDISNYNLYLSQDGNTFNTAISFTGAEKTLNGFAPDIPVFIKLTSENSYGLSEASEVLAVVPAGSGVQKCLIVNGFDRASDSNTYDFVKHHANAINEKSVPFESATNEAVTDGLISLNNYIFTDYILGEESTADETFSDSEQDVMENYLQQGGRLFVSGSEIAWDLDHKGSSTDKLFIQNYLKASYSADAPGGIASTYYSAEGIAGGIFTDITEINFDNGTHGSYNVEYADALVPRGSQSALRYKNVTTHEIGGISYEGVFGNGSASGKLIFLGFPFETIYPYSARYDVMENVLDFLYFDVVSVETNPVLSPHGYILRQNYPNPFNPVTNISFYLPVAADVTITICNTLGEEIREINKPNLTPGNHKIKFNAGSAASGIYIYTINVSGIDGSRFSEAKKMTLLK